MIPQRGGGLDERIAAAMWDTYASLPVPVVLIGMDTPQVTAGLLEAAVEPLARTMADSAFGPAEDGGFWMLGLRLPDPDLTLGVPMSEPVTGRAQLVRLVQAGLRIHMTPELVDVDTLAEAARVARQFYLEGASKVDIADRLGISRFRVARLLEAARESGMVRIEIGLPGGNLDAGLSAELCSVFGLKYAFVFNVPDDDEPALRKRLGEAAGQALMDIITPDDVLGMAWARSLSGLTAALTRFPPCPIVQLTGAVPQPDGSDLLDLVRGVARGGGGRAHVFYAPMIVADPETAAVIRRQPDVADAFALVESVTIAMVSIGAWAPGLSTIYDSITPAERDAMTEFGVHTDMGGALFDKEGNPLETPLDTRMIITPGPVLASIPTVLAVAYGAAAKSSSVLAAVRGKVINGLGTHTSLARAVLEEARDAGG